MDWSRLVGWDDTSSSRKCEDYSSHTYLGWHYNIVGEPVMYVVVYPPPILWDLACVPLYKKKENKSPHPIPFPFPFPALMICTVLNTRQNQQADILVT